MHVCPHPTCTVRIPNKLFACNPHWLALPTGVRIVLFHSGAMAPPNTILRKNAIHDALLHWRIDMGRERHASN